MALSKPKSTTGDMFYHVLIAPRPNTSPKIHVLNVLWDGLERRVLQPYRSGGWITLHGSSVKATDVQRIRILATRFKLRQEDANLPEYGFTYHHGERDITDHLIHGPPGYEEGNRETIHPEPNSWLGLFDAMITVDEIGLASRELFLDGHYQSAVENAYKAIESVVAERCGSTDYGTGLMRRAFGGEAPRIPLIPLVTEPDKQIQEGYSHLFAGSMQAIRNPRAHGSILDQPDEALELIIWAQHLMRKLKSSASD